MATPPSTTHKNLKVKKFGEKIYCASDFTKKIGSGGKYSSSPCNRAKRQNKGLCVFLHF